MYLKPICFWDVIIAHPLLYLCLLFVKDSMGGGKRGQEERRARQEKWHKNKLKPQIKNN